MSRPKKASSALADMTTDGLMELDAGGTVLYINTPAKLLLELEPGDTPRDRCFKPAKRECYRTLKKGRETLEIMARPHGNNMLFRIRPSSSGPFGPLSRGSVQELKNLMELNWLALSLMYEDEFLMNDPERLDCACGLFKNHFQLRRLAEHMELYTKLKTEDAPFYVQKYDMFTLCHDLAEAVTVLTEKQGRHVEFKFTEGDYNGTGDPNLIELALLNLITNALSYTPEGQDVVLSLTFDKTRFRVSVIDFAGELTEDKLVRVFTPGGLPLKNGRYLGMGLGLCIARDIAMLHHGTLVAKPKEGKSTVFVLSVPKICPEPLSLHCPPSSFSEHDMFLMLTELSQVADRSNYSARFFD